MYGIDLSIYEPSRIRSDSSEGRAETVKLVKLCGILFICQRVCACVRVCRLAGLFLGENQLYLRLRMSTAVVVAVSAGI